MPLSLIVLHTGFVAAQSRLFCLFWLVYNYALTVIGLMFMAYGCIERYFLVFDRIFFKKHLILLHYMPLVFLLIYPPLLYVGLIVIYPCETDLDYTKFVCGGACYQYQVRLIEHINIVVKSISDSFLESSLQIPFFKHCVTYTVIENHYPLVLDSRKELR
jgi:hypothetical protein